MVEPAPIRGIEAVSLDVTGTLIHCPRLAALYGDVLGRHGVHTSVERLRELVPIVWKELSCRVVDGRDRFAEHPAGERGFWDDFLGRLTAYLEIDHPGPFAAAELFERFARGDAWEVYPEVVGALEELRGRGLGLAVISNWDSRLPRVLDELGLERYFDVLIASSEVGFEKPHPAIFEAALAALELPPSAVVHVGDRRIADLEGARAVGMHALLLARGGGGDLRALDELSARLGAPSSGPADVLS